MKLKKIFNKILDWIDEEPVPAPVEDTSTYNNSADFLQRLCHLAKETLKNESFTPPGCPPCIPPFFLVLLSNEDHKQWSGRKREALCEVIAYNLQVEIKKLFPRSDYQTGENIVGVETESSLAYGTAQVLAIWETENKLTNIEPRQNKSLKKNLSSNLATSRSKRLIAFK